LVSVAAFRGYLVGVPHPPATAGPARRSHLFPLRDQFAGTRSWSASALDRLPRGNRRALGTGRACRVSAGFPRPGGKRPGLGSVRARSHRHHPPVDV